MKILSPFLTALLFISCNNHDRISNKSKRNSNWVWWVDASTQKGIWIPYGSSTVKNGRFTEFYFNGNKLAEGRYVAGKRVDSVLYYDTSGKQDFYDIYGKKKTMYIIKDGYRKVFSRDGRLLAESNVKDHQFYGVLVHYYSTGFKQFVRNYVKDSGWCTNYYENGQIEDSLVEFNNSSESRTFKAWFEDGHLKENEAWNMKTGLQEGATLLYYPNGQLKDSINFFNGKREGTGKSWYEDGILELIDVYKNDVLISSKTFKDNRQ